MRKTLTTLSLAVALVSGHAIADQATTDSLQAYGVQLSAAQAAAITSAEGQQLVNEIAALVAAQPEMAATIVAAAVNTNPSLSAQIQAAAIQAAPGQEAAIKAAVEAGQAGSAVSGGVQIPSSSMPSIGGAGGGSTSLASPN